MARGEPGTRRGALSQTEQEAQAALRGEDVTKRSTPVTEQSTQTPSGRAAAEAAFARQEELVEVEGVGGDVDGEGHEARSLGAAATPKKERGNDEKKKRAVAQKAAPVRKPVTRGDPTNPDVQTALAARLAQVLPMFNEARQRWTLGGKLVSAKDAESAYADAGMPFPGASPAIPETGNGAPLPQTPVEEGVEVFPSPEQRKLTDGEIQNLLHFNGKEAVSEIDYDKGKGWLEERRADPTNDIDVDDAQVRLDALYRQETTVALEDEVTAQPTSPELTKALRQYTTTRDSLREGKVLTSAGIANLQKRIPKDLKMVQGGVASQEDQRALISVTDEIIALLSNPPNPEPPAQAPATPRARTTVPPHTPEPHTEQEILAGLGVAEQAATLSAADRKRDRARKENERVAKEKAIRDAQDDLLERYEIINGTHAPQEKISPTEKDPRPETPDSTPIPVSELPAKEIAHPEHFRDYPKDTDFTELHDAPRPLSVAEAEARVRAAVEVTPRGFADLPSGADSTELHDAPRPVAETGAPARREGAPDKAQLKEGEGGTEFKKGEEVRLLYTDAHTGQQKTDFGDLESDLAIGSNFILARHEHAKSDYGKVTHLEQNDDGTVHITTATGWQITMEKNARWEARRALFLKRLYEDHPEMDPTKMPAQHLGFFARMKNKLLWGRNSHAPAERPTPARASRTPATVVAQPETHRGAEHFFGERTLKAKKGESLAGILAQKLPRHPEYAALTDAEKREVVDIFLDDIRDLTTGIRIPMGFPTPASVRGTFEHDTEINFALLDENELRTRLSHAIEHVRTHGV